MSPDATIAVYVLDTSVIDGLLSFLNYGFKGGLTLTSPTLSETMKRLRVLQSESKNELSETLGLMIQLESRW